MRLPNGFGSISKLSGKRRNPYMVRNSKGKILGYTKTRAEGIEKLVEYNKDPYDIDFKKITFKELWEDYQTTNRYKKLSVSMQRSLITAFNKSETLYHIPCQRLKVPQMQRIIDTSGKPGSQKQTKVFFKHLDDHAKTLGITNNMNSDVLDTETHTPEKAIIFTEEQINALWKRTDEEYVRHTLCLIYTGFRITAYLNLTVNDVNLDKKFLRGGIKTEAGMNRIIPIHPRIEPFVIDMVESTDNFLVPDVQDYHDRPRKFRREYKKIIKTKHLPHDARHTFRTRLYKKGVDKLVIDLLMGHKNKDVGDGVYTHLELSDLRKGINALD